jgi:hypothetical protein
MASGVQDLNVCGHATPQWRKVACIPGDAANPSPAGLTLFVCRRLTQLPALPGWRCSLALDARIRRFQQILPSSSARLITRHDQRLCAFEVVAVPDSNFKIAGPEVTDLGHVAGEARL